MRGMVALLIVALVVGGVVLIRDRGTASVPIVPEQGATHKSDQPLTPDQIVIECAQPTTFEDKAADGSVGWRIKEVTEIDTIRYIDIEHGWIDACGLKKGKAGTLPGKASYSFTASRDDKYYLSLRAQWAGSCWHSVWVRIDNGDWWMLEDYDGRVTETEYQWAWHQLFVEGRPKAFELTKGPHTLWLNTRHDGVKLHQVVLSTDANKPVGGPIKK